jgi:hypothetical protein
MRSSILVALLCCLPRLALAQPGLTPPGQTPLDQPTALAAEPKTEPQTRTESYGLYVFLADAASWSLLALASDNNDLEAVTTLGSLGLFFGGPVVHASQGNWGRAGLSLGARVGMPALTGTLLLATCDESETDEFLGCFPYFAVGAVIGYGGALALDWFVLARKEVEVEPTGWASARPSLMVTPDGAQAGLAFTF